jgi:hypothetical protein
MAAYFELEMERPFLVKVTSFLEDNLSFMGGAQGHSHQRGDSEKGDERRPLKLRGLCGNGSKKRDPNPQSHPKKTFKPQQPK